MADPPCRLWLICAEWVIGDDGRDVRLGDLLQLAVRPADADTDGDLGPVLALAVGTATTGPAIYAWHPDDPEPPVAIRGTVIRIWAHTRTTQDVPSDELHQVPLATVDDNVDRYVFELDDVRQRSMFPTAS